MVSEGRWVLGAPEGEVARLPEGGSEGLGGVHGSEGTARSVVIGVAVSGWGKVTRRGDLSREEARLIRQ